MTSYVSVIGTVFVDCKGFPFQQYNATGRNLGSIGFVHGGVGRNVVENLANLELHTAFVSSIDPTGLGDEIKKKLADQQVNTEYLVTAPANGMGMWLAIFDEKGDLAGSISQMPDLSTMERTFAQHGEEIVAKSSHVVLEIDLNEELSKRVVETAVRQGKPIFGIPGNLDVILSNRELLGHLECFICNDIEAEKIIGEGFLNASAEEQLEALVHYVDAARMKSMVVTLGEKGSVYYDARSKQSGVQPVFPVQLIDTTGAGDAFFSGTVMGLVRGLSLKEAVVCGTKVAGWTIESKESTCPELREKFQRDEVFQGLFVK
jgi:pseudouridine kinase